MQIAEVNSITFENNDLQRCEKYRTLYRTFSYKETNENIAK